ncbi:MAG: hypothetical protein AUK63_2339, partial [bacterium P3]
ELPGAKIRTFPITSKSFAAFLAANRLLLADTQRITTPQPLLGKEGLGVVDDWKGGGIDSMEAYTNNTITHAKGE